jgi:hypothetical protein
LKPKSNASTSASRESARKNPPVNGTRARTKMSITRVPQPAKTNRL